MDMVSQRNFTLRTTTGHVIRFTSGQPSFVPPPAQAAAMEAGCVPVDPKLIPKNQDQDDEYTGPAALREPQGVARQEKVREAIEAIIAKNKSTDFTASGRPHLDKLSKLLGFDITAKERDAVLEIMRQEAAEKADS